MGLISRMFGRRIPGKPGVMPNPSAAEPFSAMFMDHMNKMFAQQRTNIALGNGQDPGFFGAPFPGSSQHIKINNIGWPVVGLILGALAAAAYAIWLLRSEKLPDLVRHEPPPAVVAPDPKQPVEYQPIDLRIKWWVEQDGTANSNVEEVRP